MTQSFTRSLLLISASAFIGLTTTACAQEKSVADKPVIEAEISKTSEDVTPVKAEQHADTHGDNAHGSHDGHNHDATPMPNPDIDIDHVMTISPDDHVIGKADAPIEVIIYASVTCGHCSNWFINDWPTFKKDLIDSGTVRMAFREIPTPPAQIAATGFVLADCAPVDKYMDVIVHQMVQQKEIFASLEAGTGKETYDGIAKMAGMDTDEQVQACFNDTSHVQKINNAIKRMEAAGLKGVPNFIINGETFANPDKGIAAIKAHIQTITE